MKEKILVVEDEVIVGIDIQRSLIKLGYDVLDIVSTGEEAIKSAKELNPDLIFMDIMLKGEMDGIQAANEISKFLSVPIIYLTAYSDPDTLQRAKKTGPYGYLLKPFDEKELKIAIEMALYKAQMEKKIKDNEKWFMSILKSIGDATIVTDVDGIIQYVNPVAEKMFNSNKELIINNQWNNIFVNIEKNKLYQINKIFNLIKECKIDYSYLDDIEINKNNNILYYNGSVAAIKNDNNELWGVVFVFRDITEQKVLEKQLFQSQKMESIGLLAGGIAHDFNNILSAILGYTALLKMEIDEEHPFYSYIDTIEKSVIKGSKLTSQILTFARSGESEFVENDINDIISETFKIIEKTFAPNIQINFNYYKDLPKVKIDISQIEQIIINLCINARDAMENGGTLTIESGIEEVKENDFIKYGNVKTGEYVYFSVSDTGVGMSKDIIDKIFDPFFTTKEKGKGTGLGLAMVAGIIKRHNGFWSVDSELGKGTKFKVFLPVQRKINIEEEQKVIIKGKNELILFIDDENIICSLAKEFLENNGYRVIIAEDGETGVKIFKERSQEIDLAIFNLNMPKMNGLESFLVMKNIKPNLKAILSTGYGKSEKIKTIINNGFDGFVQKPYHINELLREIRRILDKDNK